MKSIHLSLVVMAAVSAPAVVIAQVVPVPPSQQTDTEHSTTDGASPSAESIRAMQDKIFLRKAMEGGLAEIQLGKLAAEKASAEDVKAFGQKMVDDHTQLNNSLAPLAKSRGVAEVKAMNKLDQGEYDKLNGLSGDDFDKEYLTYMMKDHHADLREFRTASAATSDPDLKEAIDKATPVIRDHMLMADKLAHAKGIPLPGRGAKPSGTS
jgi:putative membrane protein